jgi:hypothetical protein
MDIEIETLSVRDLPKDDTDTEEVRSAIVAATL